MRNLKVIRVPEDEIGIKRTYKEAIVARNKGEKLAFDLRNIKDQKTKIETILLMSRI